MSPGRCCNNGWSYWTAFAVTLALLVRRRRRSSSASSCGRSRTRRCWPSVIVFIGLGFIFNALAGWLFGYTVQSFDSRFRRPALVRQQVHVGARSRASIAVSLVVLALVFAFFRFTPLGLAMRAAAQNPASARLVGVRVGWMLALGWGLAAAIGAVAGMMAAPIVYLDPNMMGGHSALRLRRRRARRHRQPLGRRARRLPRRRASKICSAPMSSARRSSFPSRWSIIIGVLVVKPSGLFGRRIVARV